MCVCVCVFTIITGCGEKTYFTNDFIASENILHVGKYIRISYYDDYKSDLAQRFFFRLFLHTRFSRYIFVF